MKKVVVFAAALSAAVFAASALSENAGVKQVAGGQARAATLQQQVNELRNELICLEAVTGDGLGQDLWKAESAIGSPPQQQQVDDHGVCAKLGVVRPGTYPNDLTTPAVARLISRAFGR